MPLLSVYKAGGRSAAAVAQPGDSIHGPSTQNEISTSSTACVPPPTTPNLASGPPGRQDLCALDMSLRLLCAGHMVSSFPHQADTFYHVGEMNAAWMECTVLLYV